MKTEVVLIFLVFNFTSVFSQKLFTAVEKGDLNTVKKLLDEGKKPNQYAKNGLFPLWKATANNNYEICKLLLENGADVSQQTRNKPAKTTAMFIPCQEDYRNIVMLLIEYGFDVNTREYRGFTPIRIASRNGHYELVKYLAENGALIDVRAMDGATPLAHASGKGHIEIVRFLIENGANVNNQDEAGDTPLGEACRAGNLDVIKYLIRKGADLEITNKNGQNAYDVAKRFGQKNAAELIMSESK